jgi:hypothetical protein
VCICGKDSEILALDVRILFEVEIQELTVERYKRFPFLRDDGRSLVNSLCDGLLLLFLLLLLLLLLQLLLLLLFLLLLISDCEYARDATSSRTFQLGGEQRTWPLPAGRKTAPCAFSHMIYTDG